MALYPLASYNLPGVYGVEAKLVVAPLTAPGGNHDWWRPTASRSTHRCSNCGAEIFVGTEGEGSLARIGGALCSELLVRHVMES